MTEVNVPLLQETLAVVEEEAAKDEETCRWVQSEWRCGTGMCFAGWAVHLDGAEWATEDKGHPHFDDLKAVPEDGTDAYTPIYPVLGVTAVTSVRDRAERVLGIDYAEAEELFEGGNTIDDIRRLVGRILDRAQ